MSTNYPWDGKIVLQVSPESATQLAMIIRIPGWALGHENPLGLYNSRMDATIVLKVNGKSMPVTPVNGYITIDRTWQKGDEIELHLPVKPRFIYANDQVKDLSGQVAISAGPVVYSLEGNKNPDLDQIKLDTKTPMEISFQPTVNSTAGVHLAVGKQNIFVIGYEAASKKLFVDRSGCTNNSFNKNFASLSRYEAFLTHSGGKIKLHIFFDNSIVEVFANDGEAVMTTQIFPDENDNSVELFSEGGTTKFESVKLWKMRSAW